MHNRLRKVGTWAFDDEFCSLPRFEGLWGWSRCSSSNFLASTVCKVRDMAHHIRRTEIHELHTACEQCRRQRYQPPSGPMQLDCGGKGFVEAKQTSPRLDWERNWVHFELHHMEHPDLC